MKEISYHLRHKLISRFKNMNMIGFRHISHMLPNLLIPQPAGEVILNTIHGFKLKINPSIDNGVERSLYYTGTYEPGTLNAIRFFLKPGDIFVDVGANIGLMSIFAARIVGNRGRVVGFEANPETKKILDYNISINNLSNIDASGYALGSATGTGKIYTNWHINRGGASIIKPEQDSDFYEIEIIRFDQYKGKPDNIKLVKIDIEGYELEALKGFGNILSGKNAPILILECSEKKGEGSSSKEEVFDYVKSMNAYRIYKLVGGSARKSKMVEVTEGRKLPIHANMYCLLQEHMSKVDRRIFKN